MSMRVLMTADAVGGVWTYALELSRALAAHDVEVMLAVMGPPPSEDKSAEARRLGNLILRHRAFSLEWMPNPWHDVRAAGDWLLGLEDEWCPDVCHLNGYAHAACQFAAPKLVVAHSCVCSWWHAVRHHVMGDEWTPYRAAVTAGLEQADMVVAPTRWMLQQLELHYTRLVRACVIPNARDPGAFSASNKHAFVFAAGRAWDEAKNLALLDRCARGLPWPVLVAGALDGAAGRLTSGEITDGPITFENAHLLGELDSDALAHMLSMAAIYALPARYEPFGLSILEAALSGCALVLGDIPSLREHWDSAAIFVQPEDLEGACAALGRLMREPDHRRELAARAQLRAHRFAPQHQAAAYVAVYASLLRTPGRTAYIS